MILKKFGIFCASLLLLLAPQWSSRACGYDDFGDWYYRFFSPEILEVPGYKPLNFTFDRYYDYSWHADNGKTDNIAEWKEYFGGNASEKDIEQLIYTSTYDDLIHVGEYILGNRSSFDEAWITKNTVVNQMKKQRDEETIGYLQFAKACEKVVYVKWDWNSPEIPTEDLETLIGQMSHWYTSLRSDLIKLRTGFQMVRLAHYAHQYQRGLDLYEKYVVPVQVNSIINGWALGHKAGCLYRLGRKSEAAYLFSRVFDTTPSKRVQAFQSFKIQSESQWNDLMGLCRNDHEKAVCYAIRAVSPKADAIEDVKKVLELDPESELLELLLLREINKLENDLLGWDFSQAEKVFTGYFGFPDSDKGDRVRNLKQFIREAQAGGGVRNPELWAVAGGYMDYLLGNFDEAIRTQEQLLASGKLDPRETKMAKLFTFIAHVTETEKLDKNKENELWAELQSLESVLPEANYQRALDYMEDVFHRIYKSQGQPAKAMMAGRNTNLLYSQPSLPLVVDCQNWVKASGKSDYEKYLLRTYTNDIGWHNLIEVKGTIYLRNGEFKKAVAEFEELPANMLSDCQGDPFEFRVREKISCWDNPLCDEKYNKLEIAKMLMGMEDAVKKRDPKSQQYLMLMGTAMYNMSYYGPSWDFFAYGRSTYNWTTAEKTPDPYGSGWSDLARTDVRLAKSYFERAAQAADSPELKAMATFGAAKCLQKEFYTQTFAPGQEWDQYFDELYTNYRNTDFYDMAMRECRYFATYVYSR